MRIVAAFYLQIAAGASAERHAGDRIVVDQQANHDARLSLSLVLGLGTPHRNSFKFTCNATTLNSSSLVSIVCIVTLHATSNQYLKRTTTNHKRTNPDSRANSIESRSWHAFEHSIRSGVTPMLTSIQIMCKRSKQRRNDDDEHLRTSASSPLDSHANDAPSAARPAINSAKKTTPDIGKNTKQRKANTTTASSRHVPGHGLART